MSYTQPTTEFAPAQRRQIGMVSTFPPQICGLATFAAALTRALERAGCAVTAVRVREHGDGSTIESPVRGEIVHGDPRSLVRAADLLSTCDAVILQHEYGIYGGNDGSEVIDLIDEITVPVVSVLHTVPLHPSEHQRSILVDLCMRSACVVVMSSMAARRLVSTYPIDRCRVAVIPHGAAVWMGPITGMSSTQTPARVRRSPQLLTWGLLGPGKGIEHVLDALALLSDMVPPVHYTVAGVTHPKVLAGAGDTYRQSLIERTRQLGLSSAVTFDDTYRDVAALTRFISCSSLVVLPYDSLDQVTSGVLVDALAAGRPVIATAFPHATELLSSGAGIVVPHRDPSALASAIRAVLCNPTRLEAMAQEARRIAPSLSWGAVARSYLRAILQLDRVSEPVAR